MKKDDIVICFNPCETLTKNGFYSVYEANRSKIKVCNNNQNYKWYLKDRFIVYVEHLDNVSSKKSKTFSNGYGGFEIETSSVNGEDCEIDYTKYKHVKKVIFNGDFTIVILKDGRKGIANKKSKSEQNKDYGFWVAYAKALRKKTLSAIYINNANIKFNWS